MPDVLAIERLNAGYGEAIVLADLSLVVAEGEALALLGRNGMGKTTLINSIVGVTRYRGGSIRLDGREISGLQPHRRAHAGVGWVPQERNIFRSLTVEENLSAVARPGSWSRDKVYALFPRLEERRGNLGHQLSGGEQQMLAVARALMTNPALLLLDEPLEGLAPIIVEELAQALRHLAGVAMILVEQHAEIALSLTEQALLVERGRIGHRGASRALAADERLLERYVGVAATDGA